jgi:hypothetical protein
MRERTKRLGIAAETTVVFGLAVASYFPITNKLRTRDEHLFIKEVVTRNINDIETGDENVMLPGRADIHTQFAKGVIAVEEQDIEKAGDKADRDVDILSSDTLFSPKRQQDGIEQIERTLKQDIEKSVGKAQLKILGLPDDTPYSIYPYY